jgi:hypothetical protein
MNFLKVFLLIFAVPVVLTAQEMGFSCSEEIEGDYHPHYLISATGDFKNLKRRSKRRRHFWPVTLSSIGHTMASYQRYDFVGGAYFHHGIDIRAEAGSDVLAAAGGRVINVENYFPGDDAYWEVAILDEEGFIWQYHHIERESIPKEIFEAYQAKIPIEAGTKLGEVYFWKIVTFGERFHHIHLNVLGKNKEYLNPFEFLEILPDSVGPEIGELFLIQNKQVVSGNTVSSDKYTIAAEFKDWILSDVFVVPPNEVKISIDGQNPTSIWKFETLPGGADNKAFVNQFYVPEKACGDYSCRKPVIDLGFSKQGGQLFPLSSGKHQLQVWAFDYNGNYVSRKFDWVVK